MGIKWAYFFLTLVTLAIMVSVHVTTRISSHGYKAVYSSRKERIALNHHSQRKVVTPTSGDKTVYLLVQRFGGQQGAGVSAISSLQCWAGHMETPMKIVEPVIQRIGIVSSLRQSPMLELGDYFDMKHLNKASREIGYAEFVSRKEYIELKTKFAVIINIKGGGYRWSSNGTDTCYAEKRFGMTAKNFCVVEIATVDLNYLSRDFMKLISPWQNKGLTAIIGKWNGPYTPDDACKKSFQKTKIQFHPSARLIRDARRYREMFMGNSTAYTAVMIRLEHAVNLVSRESNNYTINGCLTDVIKNVQRVQEDDKSIPMIAADIGKFGSVTFSWGVKNRDLVGQGVNSTKQAIQQLAKNQVSFEKWEESFVLAADGVKSSGYIAALQRTIASHATCLVLMGGGVFQDLTVQEYVRLHPVKEERCVHYVCVDNEKLLESRE